MLDVSETNDLWSFIDQWIYNQWENLLLIDIQTAVRGFNLRDTVEESKELCALIFDSKQPASIFNIYGCASVNANIHQLCCDLCSDWLGVVD